ncbi:hypothetical protein CPB86DRAFT_165254 [Serendipita vermifera]|nr:hypothetical protein CPB86DRAFT_165254 [Serendipita vermifera]
MRSEISNESRRNESIVDGGLAKLFFARTVVFRTFIEVFKEMNGNSLYGRAKFEWLLFQILPTVRINRMDPFTALVDFCLEEVNYELLASLQSEFSIYEPLRDSGHDIESFLCVLDEAQDADTRYMGAFSDPGGFFRSPVLLPIARFMTNSNFLRVIVAGSEISPDSLTYTRRPKVGLPNFFSWVRNL